MEKQSSDETINKDIKEQPMNEVNDEEGEKLDEAVGGNGDEQVGESIDLAAGETIEERKSEKISFECININGEPKDPRKFLYENLFEDFFDGFRGDDDEANRDLQEALAESAQDAAVDTTRHRIGRYRSLGRLDNVDEDADYDPIITEEEPKGEDDDDLSDYLLDEDDKLDEAAGGAIIEDLREQNQYPRVSILNGAARRSPGPRVKWGKVRVSRAADYNGCSMNTPPQERRRTCRRGDENKGDSPKLCGILRNKEDISIPPNIGIVLDQMDANLIDSDQEEQENHADEQPKIPNGVLKNSENANGDKKKKRKPKTRRYRFSCFQRCIGMPKPSDDEDSDEDGHGVSSVPMSCLKGNVSMFPILFTPVSLINGYAIEIFHNIKSKKGISFDTDGIFYAVANSVYLKCKPEDGRMGRIHPKHAVNEKYIIRSNMLNNVYNNNKPSQTLLKLKMEIDILKKIYLKRTGRFSLLIKNPNKFVVNKIELDYDIPSMPYNSMLISQQTKFHKSSKKKLAILDLRYYKSRLGLTFLLSNLKLILDRSGNEDNTRVIRMEKTNLKYDIFKLK